MTNINEFRPVAHEKMILTFFAICDPKNFIWTHLMLLVLRMIHVKYQCIQAIGSWEDDFKGFCYINLHVYVW